MHEPVRNATGLAAIYRELIFNKMKFVSRLTNRVSLILKVIATATLVTIVDSCNTTHEIHAGKLSSAKPNDSLLVDNDGNKYPIKVLSDGNLWMTANFKLNIPGSYCYENTDENCKQYGRLYTSDAAKRGCSLLGDGWRLPGKEEWQRLAELYGPV